MRARGRLLAGASRFYMDRKVDTMLEVFGVMLPAAEAPLDREAASVLAGVMEAHVEALRAGAPGALAASLRRDAQRYLDARRRGTLRFAAAASRACDEGAWALMRLTVDAPPVPRGPERMVA